MDGRRAQMCPHRLSIHTRRTLFPGAPISMHQVGIVFDLTLISGDCVFDATLLFLSWNQWGLQWYPQQTSPNIS
jgi:hypothetical protein